MGFLNGIVLLLQQIRNVGTYGITASFENVSDGSNTFYELNANDETRGNIPDEVSEFPVPETHFDRQSHTDNSYLAPCLKTTDHE